MNKNRRKRIADLRERIDIIKNELEEVMEEEQDARDNLPNNLQDSEKAEKMDDTIGSIEYAIGNLEETIKNLDEAVSI
jgi:hypothetical protein